MTAACRMTVRTGEVVHPAFAGVGFHVSHHLHPTGKDHFDQVIAKRWRELNPSFARLTHMQRGNRQALDTLADHLLRLKDTGTEVYLATWDPEDTAEGAERAAYAKKIVDQLEYLVRERGATNVRHYCMTNELSLGKWAGLVHDLPKFRDYHRALLEELDARGLDVRLLATDASPLENWHTIEWATQNMDDITGIYGGHHYINGYDLDDETFYPWFLSNLKGGAGLARKMGKDFILGEFGCKQDGSIRDGKKMDVCIHFGKPREPMMGIQLAEAVIAALNAGICALANWTFTDYPDEYRDNYVNKWGTFKWSGNDCSTRAHYYAYGLLTKFLRGPATVFAVESSDPLVRAATVQHHGTKTWSIATVNRREDDVALALALDGPPLGLAFRKYTYDPDDVPQHPFGDLQGPAAHVTMEDGHLEDVLGAGTLTVYTTAYRDEAPSPVRAVTVERSPDRGRRVKWEPNREADFCYYRVYRSGRPDFEVGPAARIGSTIATEFVDREPGPGTPHYKVVAVNQSGNASSA